MLPLKTQSSISNFRSSQESSNSAQDMEVQGTLAAQQCEDRLLLLSLPEVLSFRHSL